jgi:hypothetical protein
MIPHQLQANMAYQVAKGMHFLHSSSVVLHDLKLLNTTSPSLTSTGAPVVFIAQCMATHLMLLCHGTALALGASSADPLLLAHHWHNCWSSGWSFDAVAPDAAVVCLPSPTTNHNMQA